MQLFNIYTLLNEYNVVAKYGKRVTNVLKENLNILMLLKLLL